VLFGSGGAKCPGSGLNDAGQGGVSEIFKEYLIQKFISLPTRNLIILEYFYTIRSADFSPQIMVI
jgi:hypothetical protein